MSDDHQRAHLKQEHLALERGCRDKVQGQALAIQAEQQRSVLI